MGLRSILHLVLSLHLICLFGQSRDFQEEVHVSVNTTNILVGETLNFSAFVYSNSTKNLSQLSSVLYVELLDESGKAIHQTKIGLQDGRGSGSIYINPDWSTSTYRLRSYTRWMMNYQSFHEQHLLIFNPYSGIRQEITVGGIPLRLNNQDTTPLETFRPLQAVSLSLGSLDAATLSVSIQKTTDQYFDNSINLDHLASDITSFTILPEYRYGLIQGVVKAGSKRMEKLRVIMTVKGSAMQIATTETDAFGRFWMNYNPNLTPENGIAQIQVEPDSTMEITLINEFYGSNDDMDKSLSEMDSSSISELINRSVISQIQNAYEVPGNQDTKSRSIYTQSDTKVYYLDDYERFPSIRDTFIEYVYYVGVSKSKDNYRMNVLCGAPPGLETSNKSPLLLLDGLKVDAEDILNQSPNEVEKIEVIPSYYFVNDLVYKGVISVHTFGRKKLEVNTLGKQFQLSGYQEYKQNKNKVIIEETSPMYETSLYWEPIHSHSSGELKIDFNTSRLEGTYQVTVRGITKHGKPINLRKYIRVAETN